MIQPITVSCSTVIRYRYASNATRMHKKFTSMQRRRFVHGEITVSDTQPIDRGLDAHPAHSWQLWTVANLLRTWASSVFRETGNQQRLTSLGYVCWPQHGSHYPLAYNNGCLRNVLLYHQLINVDHESQSAVYHFWDLGAYCKLMLIARAMDA